MINPDGLVKSPDAALRCIFRHCGVLLCTHHSSGFFRMKGEAQSQPLGAGPVLPALPANFLRNHPIFELFTSSSTLMDFLQVHQTPSAKL
jgi:hypothetical protein